MPAVEPQSEPASRRRYTARKRPRSMDTAKLVTRPVGRTRLPGLRSVTCRSTSRCSVAMPHGPRAARTSWRSRCQPSPSRRSHGSRRATWSFLQAKKASHEARQEIQAIKKGEASPVECVPTFFGEEACDEGGEDRPEPNERAWRREPPQGCVNSRLSGSLPGRFAPTIAARGTAPVGRWGVLRPVGSASWPVAAGRPSVGWRWMPGCRGTDPGAIRRAVPA